MLIDSNVPMYLVGAHPYKTDAQRWLEKLVRERRRLVTRAEVLQEILHRYVRLTVGTPSNRRSTRCWA
jgi:predicted nucleic acid-binding protein